MEPHCLSRFRNDVQTYMVCWLLCILTSSLKSEIEPNRDTDVVIVHPAHLRIWLPSGDLHFVTDVQVPRRGDVRYRVFNRCLN